MADETEEEAVIVSLDGGAEQKPPSGSEDAAVADLASQFKELQGNLEREKQARADADRRADEQRRVAVEARAEATTARTEATDRAYESVETGLAGAQSDASAAEQAYTVAMEAGNFSEAAKAQRRMSQAEARILRFEEAKADIEARRAEKPREQARPAQPDPIETFIESRSDPSKRWLREHREFLTDQRKSLKLTAAHNDALAEGITADSPQYFEHVEKFLGLRETPKAVEVNGEAKPPAAPVPARRTAAPPAAPVSGSGGGMSASSGGRVEVPLTKEQVAIAEDGTITWGAHDLAAGRIKDKAMIGQPIGRTEYARRKYVQKQQGLHDRMFYES
jgi:hypothetical protein